MRTPLTEAEHERLRMLLSWGYLGQHPADKRLINLGLAEPHASDDYSLTVPRLEQVGPEGIEPYYERTTGKVNPVSYPTIGQPDVLDPANAPQRPTFREEEVGGAFDGFTVTTDAEGGL